MFKFKKPKRDLRFLDPEILRNKSGLRFQSHLENNVINLKQTHVDDDLISKHSQDFQNADENWIQVEQGHESSNQETSNQESHSFLKLISSDSNWPHLVKNNVKFHDEESITLFDVPKPTSTKKIGVFSDSKIYSALIHSLLKPHSINVGHFNHPNTFVENKFKEFDEISAWIIFLSDEDDSDFLDQFLNRYEDKPALFLFPKMKRSNCNARIKDFVSEHGLVREELKSY